MKSSTLTAVLLLTITFLPLINSSTHAADLIVNGGFEQDVVPTAGYATYSTGSTLSGWTVGAGDVDVVNTNYFASAAGTQSLDLNGFDSGEIFQNVITVSNQTYRLSFALAANPVPRAGAGPAIKKIEVRWGTNILATIEHDITGHTADDVGWRQFSFIVQGAGSDRLTFRSLTSGNAGPAIDQVSVVSQETQVQLVEPLTIRRAVQIGFATVSGKTYQPQWGAPS